MPNFKIPPFYGSCDVCFTLFDEGKRFIQAGSKYFCQKCLHKADQDEPQILYLAAEGKCHRILDETTIGLLPEGIYTLKKVQSYIVVDKEIPNASQRQIQSSVDADCAVLEKKMSGFLLRLPGCLIVPEYNFQPDAEEYAELCEIISIPRRLHQMFLCYEQDVIGIVSVNRPKQLHEFSAYSSDYHTNSRKYFEELQLNPPIAVSVAAVLHKITPADMLAYFSPRLIGQGGETRKIVCTFFEYLRCVANGKPYRAPNWILTAPSGCGKTEVFRILRDFCEEYNIPIPIVQIDLSQFTEAGYKGKEATDIVRRIVEANNKTDGTAICFLDEADKKFVPSIGSGTDGNAAFQANLLTLVEGSMQTAEIGPDKTEYTIDTSKTMFVFMGAFQNIRDRKQKKLESRSSIGFGVSDEKPQRTNHVDNCFYEDITLEEMLEIGMLEELAGRVEQVINLHKLSEEDMRYLLEEKARSISAELGVRIELTAEAKDALLEISYSSLGIRRPMNCIRALARNVLADVYFDEGFDKKHCCIQIRSTEEAAVQMNAIADRCEATA